jgi:hypothetical protein
MSRLLPLTNGQFWQAELECSTASVERLVIEPQLAASNRALGHPTRDADPGVKPVSNSRNRRRGLAW